MSLNNEEVLRSSESNKWKKAIDHEVESLEDNHIWNLLNTPKNSKILREKWLSKLKYGIGRKINRYEACSIAKSFEQRESINFEEIFSLVVKSYTTRRLLVLAASLGCSLKQIREVTTYLISEIDGVLYIEAPTGYKTFGKVYFLKRPSMASTRQWDNGAKIWPRV